MLRRDVFRHAASGTAAAVAAPAAVAQPTTRWRLAVGFPNSLDVICNTAQVFAKLVTRMSGGRFQITTHAPGELLGAYEVFDGVKSGGVEACYTCAYYYFARDEALALGASIPFGLNSRQQYAWATSGPGAALMREYYAGHGVVNFPCGNTGAQMGGWFKREIKSVGDLRGVKMRVHGFAGRILQRLGATPVNLSGSEILPALESGAIDAARWMSPHDDAALGLDKAAPFYYYPAWWEGSSQFDVFVNQQAYNALPQAYRKMLQVAAATAHAAMQANYDARNPAALKQLVGRGTKLRPFPAEVMAAAFTEATQYYDQLAAANPAWRRIYEEYAKFRRDQSLWFRFAETTYERFMQTQKL